MAVEISLHLTIALRLAVEGALGMEPGVVIHLNERLERDIELPAIVEHAVVMVGNAPGTRVEIKSRVELTALRRAAEFSVRVAAAQRPATAAGAVVVFEHLDAVARLAQFVRRHHSGEAGPQDENRSSLRIAVEPDRPCIGRLRSQAEARHGTVHRRPAGRRSDERQEITPAHGRIVALGHLLPPWISGRSNWR